MTVELRDIRIKRSDDSEMTNSLLSQAKETEKLAVMMPSSDYSCQAPIFYYLTQVMLANGFDILQMNYGAEIFAKGLPKKSELCHDLEASLEQITVENYRNINFTFKSDATRCLPDMLKLAIIAKQEKEIIYLAPPWNDSTLWQFLTSPIYKGLHVIGNRDSGYDKEYLKIVKSKPNQSVLVIDQADHQLELSNTFESISALGDTLAKIEVWLQQGKLNKTVDQPAS